MEHKKEISLNDAPVLAKAKKDALRLLSFRARSTAELRSRLLRRRYEKETVEKAIGYFSGRGFLDDEKFAKLYALSRLQSRPSGKTQIAFDLKNKGVPGAVISRVLDSLEDFDEKQIALDTAVKRHKTMGRLPENVSKARLYGFLKRRGFTSEAVFFALARLYRRTENFE